MILSTVNKTVLVKQLNNLAKIRDIHVFAIETKRVFSMMLPFPIVSVLYSSLLH